MTTGTRAPGTDAAAPDLDDGPFRVVVDRDACVGHGRCYSVAPGVFDSDDEGFPVLLAGDVPEGALLRAQARTAAASCPEKAIGLNTV